MILGVGAASVERRVPIGAMLGLVGYLIFFPPIFVLAPLALLLVVSRPTTPRAWFWLTATAVLLGASLGQSAGIASEVMSAWGVFLSGSLVGLLIWRPRRFTDLALLATVVSLLVTTAWLRILELRWRDVQLAAAHDGWSFVRGLTRTELEQVVGGGSANRLAWYTEALAQGVATAAELYPAIMILTSLLGLAIAWRWYHRIAAQPYGHPGQGFMAFRFNDQLVWALVVGLALVILDVAAPLHGVGANLLLVVGCLYAARGAAIAWTLLHRMPFGLTLVLVISTILLLPVILGGILALGLADSWVDFRRRLRPSILGE